MFKRIALLSLLLICAQAHADTESVKKALEKNYPQLGAIDHVYKSGVPGFYEVVMDGQLYYTDANTKFLFNGSIYDLKNGKNLTEERSRKIFAVDFNSLPLNLALKRVKGDGSRKMAYLTDPNCAYCKRLEGELKDIDNVTLYRFLYPIFPGSKEKVRNILCSKDPNKTWEDWMVKGVQPPEANCPTQTDKVTELGRKLFVSGTPTLIFADGTKIPGLLPAADLEQALDGNTH